MAEMFRDNWRCLNIRSQLARFLFLVVYCSASDMQSAVQRRREQLEIELNLNTDRRSIISRSIIVGNNQRTYSSKSHNQYDACFSRRVGARIASIAASFSPTYCIVDVGATAKYYVILDTTRLFQTRSLRLPSLLSPNIVSF